MIDWEKISLEDLAGLISKELKKRGIEAILVGGACVTIYSSNRYQSFDLDFVCYEDFRKIQKALKEIGFKESGKSFYHDRCKWVVEFVSPPVAVGKEIISKFKTIKVATGSIKMIRAEDSVKDRLASYFHWNDRQGLEQAIDVCLECKIDIKEVKKWAQKEGFEDKFKKFFEKLKKATKQND